MYPDASTLRSLTAAWQPVGPRDPSLLLFGYAAVNQATPPSPQALTTWANGQYAWVAGTNYWDIDFLLAYDQANGHMPASPDDFTSWLAANGFATKQANGSYAKTGAYPVGGTDYPPGSGTGSGAMLAPGGPGSAPTPTSGASGTVGRVEAWVQAHPTESIAIGAGALLLLVLGRR